MTKKKTAAKRGQPADITQHTGTWVGNNGDGSEKVLTLVKDAVKAVEKHAEKRATKEVDHKARREMELLQHTRKQREKTAISKSTNPGRPSEDLIYLVGSREEQEAAWLECVFDPESYVARIPTGEVTGNVKVDLYRQTVFADMMVNASNFAWAGSFAEGWNLVSENSWGYPGFYSTSNGTGVCMNTTINTYVGGSAPPGRTATPTGVSAVALPATNSSFVSSPDDGSEYIMVAMGMSLTADLTPTGAADEHFVGKVLAVFTEDPERYPIMGQTAATLRAQAEQENSLVHAVEYLVTPDGQFVPSVAQHIAPVPEIFLADVPLSKGAYTWQRLFNGQATPVAYTMTLCTCAFFAESAPGTRFTVRWTGVWQFETIPSNLVRSSVMTAHANIHKPDASGTATVDDFGRPIHRPPARRSKVPVPAVLPRLSKAHPFRPTSSYALASRHVAAVTLAESRRKMRTGAGASLAPPIRKLKGTQTYAPPVSVVKAMPHLMKTLGQHRHPGLAPLSVLAASFESPGLWAQASRLGPSSLGNVLTDPGLCRCALQSGPAAVDQASESDSFSWSGFFSGLWDVVSAVGPSLLGLLL